MSFIPETTPINEVHLILGGEPISFIGLEPPPENELLYETHFDQTGFIHSEETKQTISTKNKTIDKSYMKTPEFRKIMSEAKKGHKQSFFKHSEETKERMRQSALKRWSRLRTSS